MSKPFMSVENGKGETVELELVDTISLENNKYVIVSEVGSDNAFAYRVAEKGGQTQYKSIGDGSEFNKVLEAYNEKHKED